MGAQGRIRAVGHAVRHPAQCRMRAVGRAVRHPAQGGMRAVGHAVRHPAQSGRVTAARVILAQGRTRAVGRKAYRWRALQSKA